MSQPWATPLVKVSSNHSWKVSFILKFNNILEVGQEVKADEVIARIETDKVTVDILSKFAGVITKYHATEGDTVAVGAKFVDIDPAATPGAAPAQAAAPKKEAAPVATPAPTPKVFQNSYFLIDFLGRWTRASTQGSNSCHTNCAHPSVCS